MNRTRAVFFAACIASLTGCGEPIKNIDADAKAAQSQARDAVKAAEDAARRVDELSRAAERPDGLPGEPPADPQ